MISPTITELPKKPSSRILSDSANLILRCAESGDLINAYSKEKLQHEASFENSELIAYYDEYLIDILGCVMVTDRDFYAEDLESKEFLVSEIARAERIADPPSKETKVFWVSSTCTAPESRGLGIATHLYDIVEAIAARNARKHSLVAVAQAVRPQNEGMLSFSRKRGYIEFDREFYPEDFGADSNVDARPWLIMYKIIRIPQAQGR